MDRTNPLLYALRRPIPGVVGRFVFGWLAIWLVILVTLLLIT